MHGDIDEKVFETKVPPLILQPIVENAFLHGVEAVGSGDIGILIYQKEGKLYLEVTNTGKRLSDKDKDRINKILEGDLNAIPEQSGKHTSIGIRNVNERIHLVYGNEYGLSIYQDEGLVTHSIVRLPIEESR